MSSFPLISCICISRGKPSLLERAMECFECQSYPAKELVLLCEDDDEITLRWLSEQRKYRAYRLILESGKPKRSLGWLRNRAIREAAGEYICQWDDDDWYHAERLMQQWSALQRTGRSACVLDQWLLYDAQEQNAFISHRRMWEGSIMCKTVLAMQHLYPDVARGEDTPFIQQLCSSRQLSVLNQLPGLYIYTWHGGNTWHRQHWETIFRYGRKLPEEKCRLVADIVDQRIDVTTASALLNQLFKQTNSLL